MQGWMDERIWNEAKESFLVLPEQGWSLNICAYVQQRGWNIEGMNAFIHWLPQPNGAMTFKWLTEKVSEYEAECNSTKPELPKCEQPM